MLCIKGTKQGGSSLDSFSIISQNGRSFHKLTVSLVNWGKKLKLQYFCVFLLVSPKQEGVGSHHSPGGYRDS